MPSYGGEQNGMRNILHYKSQGITEPLQLESQEEGPKFKTIISNVECRYVAHHYNSITLIILTCSFSDFCKREYTEFVRTTQIHRYTTACSYTSACGWWHMDRCQLVEILLTYDLNVNVTFLVC